MKIIFILLSGFLLSISFSNPSLYLLAWIGFLPVLYVLDNKKTLKEGFITGWILGTVIMGVASYWLYYPMADFAGMPLILVLFFVFMAVLLLGLFYGLWGILFVKINSRKIHPLLTAVSWVGIEYLRFRLMTYFPFGFIGYTQVDFNTLLQLTDIGGVFLISFIIILINIYLYKVVFLREKKSILAFLIIIFIIFSTGIYKNNQFDIDNMESLNTGIVQTRVAQEDKWLPENIRYNLNFIIDHSKEVDNTDIIITPESSLTFDIIRNSYYREIFFDKINDVDTDIIIGSQSIIDNVQEKYNSSFLITADNNIEQRYNKNELVPFGERIPLNNLVNLITGMNMRSLASGDQYTIFETDFASWLIVICSEILNPEYVRNRVNEAEFIVTQSNEAWFGITNLQEQMWTAARFRAVENRKSVVKAGNYAYSGVINPDGKIEMIKGVENKGSFVSSLYLNRGNTFYQKWGDLIGAFSLFIIFMFSLIYTAKSLSNRF